MPPNQGLFPGTYTRDPCQRRCRLLQTEALQLLEQPLARQPQRLGRARAIVGEPLQRLLDLATLQRLDLLLQAAADRCRSRFLRGEGEVPRLDLTASATEDGGALHLVAQLAQVARPAVRAERLEGLVGEQPRPPVAGEVRALVEEVLRQ